MTVSEQIVQVIDTLCQKFGIVIDWTSQNIIPYIEMLCGKFVKYEIATSIAWIVFAILACVALIIIQRVWYKKALSGDEKEFNEWFSDGRKKFEFDWEDHLELMFFSVGACIVCFFLFIVICCQVGDIIKCVMFPEMYIFEYIKTLIESGVK